MTRQRWIGALLVLSLVLTAAHSWAELNRQRDALAHQSARLTDCRRLGDEVRSLRERPPVAGEREMKHTDLAHRIETASKAAGVRPDQVLRIWPEAATRVGESPYKRRPTQVILQALTLKQTLTFLHAVAIREGDGHADLHVEAVRLTAPRNDSPAPPHKGDATSDSQASPEAWNIEVTLCHLYLAPKPIAGPADAP